MADFKTLVEQVDRSVQANLGGVPVIYQPAIGAPVTVTGVFDSQFVLVEGTTGDAGVEALGPAVFLRLDDLPTDPEVDTPTLTIASVIYRVVERRPDGFGGIVLVLRTVT